MPRSCTCSLCGARSVAVVDWHMVRDADGRECWACSDCVVGIAMEQDLPPSPQPSNARQGSN
jgi:Zn-finger protein